MKLGGSVITKKQKLSTPNKKVIERLVGEIKQADLKSLIIVHGGGSFGHPFAKKYDIAAGYKSLKQLIGFSKTHQVMMTLNSLVINAFIKQNIPAIAIQPSSFILTRKGRISTLNFNIIVRMLSLNLVPILYGDAVIDEEQGFSILSGDQLVAALAISLKSNRIVICVDVDGLYTADPKTDPTAKLIRKLSVSGLKVFLEKIGESQTVDVTGGMYGKICELIPAVEQGINVKIVNALKVNRLTKVLIDEEVKGTQINP